MILMRIRLGVIAVLLFGNYSVLKAQDTWNLSKCINYALENNIDLNQAQNQVEMQKYNLLESKAQRLPNLNLGAGVYVNFGRSIDATDNTVTYNQNLYNDYGLSSSLDIFRGFIKTNTIKYNKYLLAASQEGSELQKNQLIIQVMSSYYRLVYSQGMVDVSRDQTELSQALISRMEMIVEVGRESPVMVQELKSQWAEDQLNFIRSKNEFNNAKLELQQLLRITGESDFKIDTLNPLHVFSGMIPSVDSIYQQAVMMMPEIKQRENQINAAERDLRIAKGGISPRLYMSAGIGSGFFDGDTTLYLDQLKNNQNQSVNLGLRIPIFNHASTYSNIKRKKIALKDREFDLEKQKETLFAEIWKAVDDLNAAESEYQSSLELLEFSELNLKNVSKKLEKGLASGTDFQSAKQRYSHAQATLLKAKLIYVMRGLMIEFYRTGNWKHLQG